MYAAKPDPRNLRQYDQGLVDGQPNRSNSPEIDFEATFANSYCSARDYPPRFCVVDSECERMRGCREFNWLIVYSLDALTYIHATERQIATEDPNALPYHV